MKSALLVVGFATAVTVAFFVVRTTTRGSAPPAEQRVLLEPVADAGEGAALAPMPPPVLYALPDFRLTNERAASFGLADLRGKTWIASFFFTSCPSICPRIMKHVARVQSDTSAYGDGVRLVTFSVDPATDTPARLAKSAREYGANPARWTLLTGPIPEIERAVKMGFKQAMDRQNVPVKNALGEDAFDITHGAQLVLVDDAGNIRGYYDSDEPGRKALLRAVAAIAKAP